MPLPTLAEYAAVAEAQLRTALDPAGAGLVDLSDGSSLTVLVSAITAALMRANMAVAKDLANRDLSSADEDGLAVVGPDIFDETQKAASAATTTLYLQRPGTPPLAATSIPVGSRFGAPASDNSPAVDFSADDTTSVDSSTTKVAISVTCTQTGAVGDIDPATITSIVDALPDSTWALYTPSSGNPGPAPDLATSAATLGGGADKEDADTFRQRLQAIPSDASRQKGLLASVLAGVLRVPGVYAADVVAPGDGSCSVYVGDLNYLLPDALRAAVEAELVNWVCCGVTANVYAYTNSTTQITGTIYMAKALSNYDTAAIKSAAAAAIKSYFATGRQRPDEYFLSLVRDAMISGAKSVTSAADVQDAAVSAPASDQLRRTDASYTAAATRYVVNDSSISISVQGPRTS